MVETSRPIANEPNPKPCPICGKPSAPVAWPFCSGRCADVDLHRWLGGVYAVPAVETEPTPDDDDES